MANVGRRWTTLPAHTESTEIHALHLQLASLQEAMAFSRHEVEEFRSRVSASLKASERRYRELFENVLTGVYRLRLDGSLELANPAFVRLMGFSSFEEMGGLRLNPPNELRRAAGADRIAGCERTLTRRDGTRVVVRESCRAVIDERGHLTAWEGVVEDITSEKKTELYENDCRALLERVARNEPLYEILEQLAHIVESQMPDSGCSVLLNRGGVLQKAAGQNVPAECRTSLGDDLLLAGHRSEPPRAPGRPGTAAHPIVSGRGEILGSIVAWGPGPLAPEILRTACGLASIALEHSRLCDSLEAQANRDTLTGLANRTMLERRLSSVLQAHDALALCWLDLDRFKEINESLGHPTGDELLRQVSCRLQRHVPERAMLARMGGDEFALVLPGADSEAASALAKELLSALHAPFQLNGFELFVTASVGIALYPEHGLSVSELQQNADAAMYRAKAGGRNRFSIFEEDISITVRERMETAQGLRRALQRNELRLFYQPQADLDGNVVAFEALLRWEHPVRGMLTPADFIATAEETGLIVPIGSWVIEEACRQAACWNASRTLQPLKVAVNVSSLQFYFSDLAEVVAAALEKTGLPPECLELELTESILVRDTGSCATDLQRLRGLGITIAIDDFGTGYSCLSYLQQLPVDVVKVDRSFLADLHSRSGAAVLEAVTALAHSLNLRVVAEGVEREDQMSALREFHVDLVQGYLIGLPERAEVVTRMIRSGGPADSPLAGADEVHEMQGVL